MPGIAAPVKSFVSVSATNPPGSGRTKSVMPWTRNIVESVTTIDCNLRKATKNPLKAPTATPTARPAATAPT